jgi:GNAT superfamily N-acetyltransferase
VKDAADGRRREIALTATGLAQFKVVDRRQRQEVEAALTRLDAPQRSRLVGALSDAQALLEGLDTRDFTLRTFRPGDMGLIVSRQAILYTQAYGWNENLEINESDVTSAFLKNFKPKREQCWIAEVAGTMAGSVILTDEGDGLSRLRLLYVEPPFQGRGIGDALVSACLAFARSVGYTRMTLWTHSILEGARRIYARHGFEMVSSEPHDLFGPVLTGEIWDVQL